MSNQDIKNFTLEEQLQFTANARLICKNQNVTTNNSKPAKRYGHLSFIYKGKLYVQGGYSSEGKNQNPPNADTKNNIYSINLQKQRTSSPDDKKVKKSNEVFQAKWEVVQAKFTPAAETQFQILAYQAHCIFPHKKRLYMFGGATVDGKVSNSLFRLDLDSLQWSKPQQKGTVPKARQDSSLSLYTKNQKNYLVLYGGANYQNYQIYSDIHFYQIETKYWFQCHNLSSNFIQPRLSPSVCFNDNKIYIFGGYYVDTHRQKGYLNDLYEIQFALSVQKGRPYGRSFARRLDQVNIFDQEKYLKPQNRCSSSINFYKADFVQSSQIQNSKKQNKLLNNWILLIGGQKICDQKKKVLTLNDMWLFSLYDLKWRPVSVLNEFKPRSSFSTVIDKEFNKFFIFGGLSSLQVLLNDLVSIKISCKSLQYQNEDNKQIQQQMQSSQVESNNYEGFILQQISNNINFPFAAFGLIVDNFVSFQAQFCDISYHISKSKPVYQNYIKFQSNANFTISNQILLSSFTCLKGGIRTYVAGTDKKIKAEMNKQNLSKQIGSNFLQGGLRLGNQILFLNLDQQSYEIQIILVMNCNDLLGQKIQNEDYKSLGLKSYKLFSFLVSREQIMCEQVFSYARNSQESKKRKNFFQKICPDQYRERIKLLISQGINNIKKGEIKNILYISKLKTIDGQECDPQTHQSMLEIFPDMLRNDMIYGDLQIIKEVQSNKIPAYQSLDISLKAYMSYLYVHCETQLTVSIHGFEKKTIHVQQYIPKIDELLKNKEVVEISSQFEFDCKIIEIYNLYEKQPTLPPVRTYDKFFANGILLYHKSRLIKRQGIELGEYLLNYKLSSIRNQGNKGVQPVILCSSNNYSMKQIFGHIELPDPVPVNSTKTDFVFPVMLEKIEQKIRMMEDQVKKARLSKKQLKPAKGQ